MPGAFILGCAGKDLSAEEARFFRDADPWGFILFDRNLSDKSQVGRLCAALRDTVGREAPILIDQEGGRVQRLWPPIWRQHPPALDLCEASRDPERAMFLRGALIGQELRDLGIDVNCAPLADIAGPATHPRLKNRCYGFDADTVVVRAKSLVEGQKALGIAPVLKHIPGHGRGTKDSHLELPRVSTPLDALSSSDFATFAALSHLPMGITAHVVFEALDPERPATTSPSVHAHIRDTLGFNGLLMTDDLSMEALTGTPYERSLAALSAGCDLILHCNGALDEMRGVADVGPMSAAAEDRAAHALTWRGTSADIDISAFEAELSELSEGVA